MSTTEIEMRSKPAPQAAAPPVRAAAWGPALGALAIGLGLLLGVVFQEESLAAVRVWDSSTAYNHCWLVLPVALWLAWSRRDRLAGLAPSPLPAAALLGLPAGLAWFAAERLGIMEGRQLAVIGLTWALFLAVLGWRVFRAMAAPIAYLIFLVPFGAFLTPVLQDITAWIIDVLLDLWGIPHFVDQLIIDIPAGTFLVAEACAGLRFLIAALAFGALYAMVMFRSPGRRLIVLVLSLVVPIFANGLRAFGIVLLGHYLGSAEAAAADHVLYGWIFFSIVILLLILAGLPFREDETPPVAAAVAPGSLSGSAGVRGGRAALAAAASVVVAAAGPGAAMAVEGSNRQGVAETLALAPMPGCIAQREGLRCGEEPAFIASARMLVFPPRAGWGAVGAARVRALEAPGEEDTTFTHAPPGEGVWNARLLATPAAPRAIATAIWLDGEPTSGGLRSRLAQAMNSLTGARGAPVILVVSVVPATPPTQPGRNVRAASAGEGAVLRAVLETQGAALATRARQRSATRPG